jgi:hypothetical protein
VVGAQRRLGVLLEWEYGNVLGAVGMLLQLM